jgi:hypothetical protein
MLFVPSAAQDIHKYFKNSFLKFKETGDMLFYMTHVDNSMISGQIEDGRDFKLYLSEDEPYEVDYILPHKSFFQYGEHACMLQRVPAKQYHRGITDENTQISYRVGADGAQKHLPINFEVLKAFVQKKKFFSLTEALQQPVVSCALSPRMMYSRLPKTIFIDFHAVAKVNEPKKIIHLLQPIFKQEIQDLLRQNMELEHFNFSEKKEQ